MNLLTAVLLFLATEIAPGVVLIEGQLASGSSPDGNTVLLRGSEGWVGDRYRPWRGSYR